MNIEDLAARLADAQAAYDKALDERAATGNAAAKAFVMEYDWEVTFPHPAQFKVARKLSADCNARLAAFKAAYPYTSQPRPFVGSMTYSVLKGTDGCDYVQSGGGSVIVDLTSNSFGPSPIAPADLAAFLAGRVPEHLKRA